MCIVKIECWSDDKGKNIAEISVEVTKEIFDVFEEGRRQKIREENEFSRHGDKYEKLPYEDLPDWYNLSEHVEHRDNLKKIMDILDSCTEIQKERFLLNTIHGMTYREIAEAELCSWQAVKHSVGQVWDKIKNTLN
jgi:RNA polymerase sigma-70 factor (ECF subfamily)